MEKAARVYAALMIACAMANQILFAYILVRIPYWQGLPDKSFHGLDRWVLDSTGRAALAGIALAVCGVALLLGCVGGWVKCRDDDSAKGMFLTAAGLAFGALSVPVLFWLVAGGKQPQGMERITRIAVAATANVAVGIALWAFWRRKWGRSNAIPSLQSKIIDHQS